MATISNVQSLGIPCSQYIDDRHIGQLALLLIWLTRLKKWTNVEYADAATFVCTAVVVSLGYSSPAWFLYKPQGFWDLLWMFIYVLS